MCNWRAWILPGLITLIILTALAVLVRGGPIEADLTARSAEIYESDGVPWASASLDGRDVTLTGVAPSEAAQEAAIASANRVPGVFTVDTSGLELLPLAEPYTLSFLKDDAAITVGGHFPTGDVRAAVLDDVRAVAGDLEVIDETNLARGAAINFDDQADFAVAGLAALSSGTVELSDGQLSVAGASSTLEAYDAELARLATPIDGIEVASVSIDPPIVSPYTWNADASDAGVTLTGFVPDEPERSTIVDAASALGMVNDQMERGFGAPEGFASAAGALLNQMAGLENATASISDLDLSISGEAADSAAYDAANAFLGNLPEGFNTLSGRIEPPIADPFVTSLTKTDGGYTLSGVLPSETARAHIFDALQGENVTDTATIARGAPDGVAVGELFATASNTLKTLVDGEATLTGSDFTVSGTATSFSGADSAVAAIDALGTDSLNVTSDIARGPASPYVFNALASASSIDLEGFIPSENARSVILDNIAAVFPTLDVNDGLVVADGAPEGFGALIDNGLRRISRLEAGSLSISDTDVEISGAALYQRALDLFSDTSAFALPQGFSLNTDIGLAPPPEPVDPLQCQVTLATLMGRDSIRFDTGSASIDSLSFGLLDRLVRTLQSCPDSRVEVGGHTDSQGSESGNQALSESRAGAVLDYIVGAGISADRMVAVGYGEANPIADNETEEGRARNRRIAFTVLEDPEPEPAPAPTQDAEQAPASDDAAPSTDQ